MIGTWNIVFAAIVVSNQIEPHRCYNCSKSGYFETTCAKVTAHDSQTSKKETAHDAIQVPCIALHAIAANGSAAPEKTARHVDSLASTELIHKLQRSAKKASFICAGVLL